MVSELSYPGWGYSAYRSVLESNLPDLFGWGEKDEDLLFVQDTSLTGQFAQQRESRMTAR